MNKKQKEEVIESLVKFVKQVSDDKEASPAAIAILPEIAKVLFDVTFKSVA